MTSGRCGGAVGLYVHLSSSCEWLALRIVRLATRFGDGAPTCQPCTFSLMISRIGGLALAVVFDHCLLCGWDTRYNAFYYVSDRDFDPSNASMHETAVPSGTRCVRHKPLSAESLMFPHATLSDEDSAHVTLTGDGQVCKTERP